MLQRRDNKQTIHVIEIINKLYMYREDIINKLYMLQRRDNKQTIHVIEIINKLYMLQR